MKNRWVRVVMAAIVAEVLPILALIAIVFATSRGDQAADAARAADLGAWVGPLGGAIATLAAAWWAALRMSENQIAQGLLVGVAVAAVDALLIVLSGAAFEMLFAASWAGRVVAGWAGGALAARQRASA